MMIANGSTAGGATRVLVLGLTAANVERLMRGKPIRVRREVHGEGVPLGLEVLLLYGADEKSLLAQVRPGCDPDAVTRPEDGLSDSNPENS